MALFRKKHLYVRRGGESVGTRRIFSFASGPAPRRRKSPRLKKILSYGIVLFLALFLAGSISLIGLFAWFSRDLPDPNNINFRSVAQTTKIYDRTGAALLYEIHGEQKRTVIGLDQISSYAKNAAIAIEDKDFYRHKGFDLRGIARAILKNFLRGGKVQGGSTITQQFIKNSVLSPEKTYTRKIKELVLSLEIERRFSKEQILKLYFNEIPYGSVAYGIESASQSFFGKPADSLTLAESALLASLPKAPTYYSPYGTHRDELLTRYETILDAMAAQGYISLQEAVDAKKEDILSKIKPKKEPIIAPHFVFYVRELLAEQFGEQVVERGGLKVITTLDAKKQKLAEDTINENIGLIKKWGANTAGQVAIDPKNGDILTMVGSADYFDESIGGKYNAVLGRRQPGSSIKPMVYAAAFEKGLTPDTVLYDVATVFKNYPKDYEPADYDQKERGPVTIREALAGSLNIPAVKVLYLTGLERFIDFAKRLGYSTFNDKSRFGLSLVLGGGEVRPLEHIAAFSVFAQEGVGQQARAILRVEDKDGDAIFDPKNPSGTKVFDQEIARQITSILSDNAARAYIFGEKNYLTLPDRPVAAKTGTTNNFKDAWAIGYTPSLVSGVWVGNSKGEEMKKGADGSKIAAPIWNSFMQKSLAGTEPEQFNPPQPVVTGKSVLDGQKNSQVKVKIDKISGKLATQFTPPETVEERGFGVPHSILFFVDKDDLRGNPPLNPENDPQFEGWEKGIAEWAIKQNIALASPPTEYDDIHVPENLPTLSFLSPANNDAVSSRSFSPMIAVQARRGVARITYAMDGDVFAAVAVPPFSGPITIPNRFVKGFHTLTARAYDDVENSATTDVTVNLTADPGPIGVTWLAPRNGQILPQNGQFPYVVQLKLDDPKSILLLQLSAINQQDNSNETIGSIENPALPELAFQWQKPPQIGPYLLQIKAVLAGGISQTDDLMVQVR